ncbi:MAG: hypothetical protein ACREC6_00730 [Hyphomicrobiaceae bacterium]
MKPLHVTFTGLDAWTPVRELSALSREFPIEWGILLHPARQGSGRYPPLADIRSMLSLDLRFSAHLCGGYARDVVRSVNLPAVLMPLLDRCHRVQINTSERGIEPDRIAAFAARFNARGILQCRGFERFPEHPGVDWLFDRSGGKGRLPDRWPLPGPSLPIAGYSGGLGPDTVETALAVIARQHPAHVPFWIDMESAIRIDDRFDLGKCRRVCEIVYG